LCKFENKFRETDIVESFDPMRDRQWKVEIQDPQFAGVRSIVPL